MKQYDNVTIFDHPLISHKVAILRDEKTSMKEFRELVEEITTLMTFEALRCGVPTEERQVKTPLEVCTQTVVKDNAIVIVPILRAGLGLVEGVLKYRSGLEHLERFVSVEELPGVLDEYFHIKCEGVRFRPYGPIDV